MAIWSKLPRRKYRPTWFGRTLQGRYLAAVDRHPFLLFGLPFLATVLGGSFALTPVTALRYEAHDRKVRQLGKDEELGLGRGRRKVDVREEYIRLQGKVSSACPLLPSSHPSRSGWWRGKLRPSPQGLIVMCVCGRTWTIGNRSE